MIRRFSVLLLVCACSRNPPTHDAPSPAPAPEPTASTGASLASCDERREALLALLSAPHDPPTRAELERTCSGPKAVLLELAQDRSARGLLRLRAIEGLADYDDAPVREVLRLRAQDTGELASVRRAAVTALARSEGAASESFVTTALDLLNDADAQVRLAVVRELGRSADPRAKAGLEQRRSQEPEGFVRAAIERALSP